MRTTGARNFQDKEQHAWHGRCREAEHRARGPHGEPVSMAAPITILDLSLSFPAMTRRKPDLLTAVLKMKRNVSRGC